MLTVGSPRIDWTCYRKIGDAQVSSRSETRAFGLGGRPLALEHFGHCDQGSLLPRQSGLEHRIHPRRIFRYGGISGVFVFAWARDLCFGSHFIFDESCHFSLREVGRAGLVHVLYAPHRLVLAWPQCIVPTTSVADFCGLVAN